MGMPPFRVPQKTYFNDFLNENYDLKSYHKDINHQNFYIYYKNEKQFHDANKRTFIEKKKDFKNNEINIKFVFVTYHVIIEKKRKQSQYRICKKNFFLNNLLHAYIKIKFYSRKHL